MTESSIFTAALEKATDEERAAYLAEACGGDEKLRRRVEVLLRAHAGSDDILDPPAAGVATVDEMPMTERPGSRIGPYKLMEQIGEGGFGLVFVAEQHEPVRRKVALKVIKPGMDSAQVIARFEAERQALALMDHPNIAKVFEAGTTDSGRPYFVMELVKGIPITAYCDQNQLTPRERLELFVSVCQAIQHAHQKGIIHRDVKPPNVLVTSDDGRPVAKVIDFGVAKAVHQQLTDRTIYTQFAQMIGTPLYMSPEQAEMSGLDIDTRSDIYSLGVLLYELLTGTTPLERKRFAKAAYDEIRRLIREEEPPKPSQRLSTSDTLPSVAACRKTEPAKLTRMMRGELDWIVMKALEKDRTRRYETASGLAKDVQRYLADELVEARPPSAGYRLRKFGRKNRAALTTAAAMALLLVAGVAFSLWQAQKARAAAEAERQANTETQVVLEFVDKHILAAARPLGQEGGLGRDVTLREAIAEAVKYVDKSFREQPLIEARLRTTLGTSYHYLGEEGIAIEQFQRARAIYTHHRGQNHSDTLASMHNLAHSYKDAGRIDEARQLFEMTLKLRKEALGHDHPDTLLTSLLLGCAYNRLGRVDEALELQEATQKLCEATLGPDHPHTLYNMNVLAFDYAALGRHREALKLSQRVLASQRARFGPNDVWTLNAMCQVAECHAALGQYADSIKLWNETLTIHEKVFGPEHPRTFYSMLRLAGTCDAGGQEADAFGHWEELLRRQKKKLPPNDPQMLWTMTSLAVLLATASDGNFRDYSRALELAKQAVDLSPDEPGFWGARGIALYRNCEWTAAKTDLQKSTAGRTLKTPDDLANQAELCFFLAMAHWQLGEKKEARMCYDKAVECMGKRGDMVATFLKRERAEAAELLGLEKNRAPGPLII